MALRIWRHHMRIQTGPYTWDDQVLDQDLDLLVGKTPQCINKTTKNVKEILADRSPSRGTTYLWIDALCIN